MILDRISSHLCPFCVWLGKGLCIGVAGVCSGCELGPTNAFFGTVLVCKNESCVRTCTECSLEQISGVLACQEQPSNSSLRQSNRIPAPSDEPTTASPAGSALRAAYRSCSLRHTGTALGKLSTSLSFSAATPALRPTRMTYCHDSARCADASSSWKRNLEVINEKFVDLPTFMTSSSPRRRKRRGSPS